MRGNAWQLDGVDISDPTTGGQLVSFNHDTIEELQVQTGGHPAEYGQVTGASLLSEPSDFLPQGQLQKSACIGHLTKSETPMKMVPEVGVEPTRSVSSTGF